MFKVRTGRHSWVRIGIRRREGKFGKTGTERSWVEIGISNSGWLTGIPGLMEIVMRVVNGSDVMRGNGIRDAIMHYAYGSEPFA